MSSSIFKSSDLQSLLTKEKRERERAKERKKENTQINASPILAA
jgi:hypothetical protein